MAEDRRGENDDVDESVYRILESIGVNARTPEGRELTRKNNAYLNSARDNEEKRSAGIRKSLMSGFFTIAFSVLWSAIVAGGTYILTTLNNGGVHK